MSIKKSEIIYNVLLNISIFITMFIVSYLLGSAFVHADQCSGTIMKVGIIDSGYTPALFSISSPKLCPTGHYDFSKKSPSIREDVLGHGTFVTQLVNDTANKNNICFEIYKVFGPNISPRSVEDAILMAFNSGVKVVNMSLSINEYSRRLHRIVQYVTKRGMIIFVSAGNENHNLNKLCRVYPTCLKNINSNLRVVGALDTYNDKANYSNYGLRLDIWEDGDLQSLFNRMRGTSFASPRATGKYINAVVKK